MHGSISLCGITEAFLMGQESLGTIDCLGNKRSTIDIVWLINTRRSGSVILIFFLNRVKIESCARNFKSPRKLAHCEKPYC